MTITYTEAELDLRQQALLILFKNFCNTHPNKSIYECAEEWSNKQATTSGLVSYFKAYYNK